MTPWPFEVSARGERQTVWIPFSEITYRALQAKILVHTSIEIHAAQMMAEIRQLAQYHRRCLGQRARRLFTTTTKGIA